MRQAFLQREIDMGKKWRRVLATDIQYGLVNLRQLVFRKIPTLKRMDVILKHRIGIFDSSPEVLGMILCQHFGWSRVTNDSRSKCSHRANFVALRVEFRSAFKSACKLRDAGYQKRKCRFKQSERVHELWGGPCDL